MLIGNGLKQSFSLCFKDKVASKVSRKQRETQSQMKVKINFKM